MAKVSGHNINGKLLNGNRNLHKQAESYIPTLNI